MACSSECVCVRERHWPCFSGLLLALFSLCPLERKAGFPAGLLHRGELMNPF